MQSSSCCHAFVQQLKAGSEGSVEALFALVFFFCSFFKYRLKRAGGHCNYYFLLNSTINVLFVP